MLYAEVVLPLAQPMYTFSLEDTLGVEVGDAVVVQFGSSRFYTGIVWSISSQKPSYPRLKPILKRLYNHPLISERTQRVWEWIADYYMCTLGEVMRIALPSLAKPSATSLAEIDERSITPPVERYVALKEELRTEEALLHYVEKYSRRAPRRTAAMEAIAAMAAERNAEDGFVARRRLNIDNATLAALRKQGLVSEELRPRESVTNNAAADFLLPTLSPAQSIALESIREAHREGRVALLHGITGSGKTEIYIQLMADALSAGGDVLMLVPEIAITSQLIERLERIFEGRTTSYHSHLTALRRGRTFLRMATSMGGELIVGVRSSIFLPLNKLSLIIVDEEHDPSYKQSDMQPRYNARDCAVVAGRIFGARVVLGSATPSLESYLNALTKKYAYVPLNERWGESTLPEIVVSDTLRAVKRGERRSHFNFDLLNSINGSIERGEQVILFQNRRGYAPFVQCRGCGYTPRCPHCNVTLTQHKSSGRLECHYCGYNTPQPTVCPNCKTQDIAAMGFGTEKVEEEISKLYPSARVARLDGDSSTSESHFKRIVQSFEQRQCDILIGTQIVTKGFDFGGVTTVGILNADNLLTSPDFRASERAFQLMQQVAGRAGRRKDVGRVVIQTSQPKHPIISYVAMGDYHSMAQQELAERKTYGYPPYSHLVRVLMHHRNYELLHFAAHRTAELMRAKFGSRVMGPVAAAREMLRGEYRAEILLKIESGASMSRMRTLLRDVLKSVNEDAKLRAVTLTVDVDAW